MLRLRKFFEIRIPGGPMHLLHMLNFKLETSRKSTKQQRLVLLHISGFDQKNFGLRFSIFQVF